MSISIRLRVDPSRSTIAADAVQWVTAFHPDVSIAFDDDEVVLGSSVRGEADLRLVWQAALINEGLLARGAEARAAILKELVR